MLKEFKEFAFKGNVVDMAVGVIIGGAFGKIVTSLVNDIIMPIIGKLTSGVDIKNLKYVFGVAADGTESAAQKWPEHLFGSPNGLLLQTGAEAWRNCVVLYRIGVH